MKFGEVVVKQEHLAGLTGLAGLALGLAAGMVAAKPLERAARIYTTNEPIYAIVDVNKKPCLLEKRSGAKAEIHQSGKTMLLEAPESAVKASMEYCLKENDYLHQHYNEMIDAARKLEMKISKRYFENITPSNGAFGGNVKENPFSLSIIYVQEDDYLVPYISSNIGRKKILRGMKTENPINDAIKSLKNIGAEIVGAKDLLEDLAFQ